MDVDTAHSYWCRSIIQGINPDINVDIEYFGVGEQKALDGGYAVLSQSITAMSDSQQEYGALMLESGGISVRSHYGNDLYFYTEVTSEVGAIVAVRDVDGSIGPGVEFTLTEYTNESGCCAYMAVRS